MFQRRLMHVVTLLIAFTATIPATAGDLELKCRPLYGLEDFRGVRPADVMAVPAPYTYYLFDNAELLHYRVRLTNIGPRPIEVGELDWPASLFVAASRDGVELDPASIRLQPLGRMVIDTRYYHRGEALENVSFVRREKHRGSTPIQEYDDWVEVTREVDAAPQSLETYQSLVVEFAITGRDGEALAPGIYRVDFADPRSGLSCEHPQQLVLREAESELDRVDQQIVRYRFAKARGDLEAAGEELRAATDMAPGNLKAWYYRAAHAYATGDLEGRLLAVEKKRQILASRGAENEAVSPQIKVLARGSVGNLDELRAEVAAARAAEGEDLSDPGGPPVH